MEGLELSPIYVDTGDARWLISAVNSVLARHDNGGADIKTLEISFIFGAFKDRTVSVFVRHDHAEDIKSAHVTAWLRFAERRVTGHFTLEVPMLPRPMCREELAVEVPMLSRPMCREELAAAAKRSVLHVGLCSSAMFESMWLRLGNAKLTVPTATAGAFGALTDVRLSTIKVDAGSGRRLCHLLSSSRCPQQRNLTLQSIIGVTALRLDAAGTLETLKLSRLPDLTALEVDAPGLQELTVQNISLDLATAVRISAPRLQVLTCPDRTAPPRIASMSK
ncbi:hypothetical protein E2562_024366 [Oryza meyeriana var. granulata]|uniref:Uncharacterized protein n=1 Tax=Oryza meyeriana var. granulata TaxID=110450 RepID=A0A6G1C7S2_9ORYZ|nr:hypothetical protein E2562_024366 [Oryza meyeriana var. granulata]